VKVRDGAHVRNKAAHIVVGVDLDGVKHVLGIWVSATEGAKFWAGVCAELADRGVTDILIACRDGHVGLPEAIEATFPRATVQTCVVHLIRASMRFVSYTERKKVAAGLRPNYTAANADAAETALLELTESDLGQRHPAVIATWQRAWERFTPFLAFPPDVRKIIYTTDEIVKLAPACRPVSWFASGRRGPRRLVRPARRRLSLRRVVACRCRRRRAGGSSPAVTGHRQ